MILLWLMYAGVKEAIITAGSLLCSPQEKCLGDRKVILEPWSWGMNAQCWVGSRWGVRNCPGQWRHNVLGSELVGSGAAAGRALIGWIWIPPSVMPGWVGLMYCICTSRDRISAGFCTVINWSPLRQMEEGISQVNRHMWKTLPPFHIYTKC